MTGKKKAMAAGPAVYAVYGQSGEYSDHMEWYICYYTDKALARNHAELAAAEDRRIRQWLQDHDHDTWSDAAKRACANPWDASRDSSTVGYSGCEYGVIELWPGPLLAKRSLRSTARMPA